VPEVFAQTASTFIAAIVSPKTTVMSDVVAVMTARCRQTRWCPQRSFPQARPTSDQRF
jgi:hypothetical protein